MKGEASIRLGLNIPLFVVSTIAMALGTLIGTSGVWSYATRGLIIPEWIKVSLTGGPRY